MTDVIHLKNEDIRKELFDRAHFIFWAAGGAMGDGGAVCIVTDDGKAYYCNCVYGDNGYIADAKLVGKACPIIAAEEFPPEGWVYHYLGFGNNLLYRSEYDEEYCRLLGETDEDNPAREYHNWLGIAVKLCSKPRG